MKKGKLPALEMTRRRFDSIALAIATLPALLIWPTIVTGPVAIYLCFTHWNDPPGILRRSRWRLIAAFCIGIVQVASWAGLGIYLFTSRDRLML
ncbi:MAG: hypothetical protein ABJF23_24425 [Bryobacteraceae bacterium]